jgi:hypothetical protein
MQGYNPCRHGVEPYDIKTRLPQHLGKLLRAGVHAD